MQTNEVATEEIPQNGLEIKSLKKTKKSFKKGIDKKEKMW